MFSDRSFSKVDLETSKCQTEEEADTASEAQDESGLERDDDVGAAQWATG